MNMQWIGIPGHNFYTGYTQRGVFVFIIFVVVLWESSNWCMVHLIYTYMCFHRMQEITSTAMEAITPIAADRPRVTLIATTLWWENSSQLPHTGRQSEVFSTVVQEKPFWHWSVLQFSCWTPVGGWMAVSFRPPLLPPPKPGTLARLLWFDTSEAFLCT